MCKILKIFNLPTCMHKKNEKCLRVAGYYKRLVTRRLEREYKSQMILISWLLAAAGAVTTAVSPLELSTKLCEVLLLFDHQWAALL